MNVGPLVLRTQMFKIAIYCWLFFSFKMYVVSFHISLGSSALNSILSDVKIVSPACFLGSFA